MKPKMAKGKSAATVNSKPVKADKPDPVEVAEIMPQYPGGIQALAFIFEKKYSFARNILQTVRMY